jgi:hypothetical protein
MRCACALALVAVLATGTSAVAQDATVADEAAVDTVVAVAPASAPAPRRLPSIGLMADAGLPDGMQVSLVWRPWKALRMSAGGGYNMISKGVRIGATLLPFGRGPSGTLEAGHFFEGNANNAAAKFFGPGIVTSDFGPTLERVGYDFVNAHLGLDFGYKRVTFFIHGGMSYIWSHIYNVDALLNNKTPSINGQNANGTEFSIPQGANLKVTGPSGKVGLIVYFG